MGLELRESLGPLAQTLVLLGSVVGDLCRGWPIGEIAIVGQRGVAIALAAKRKRLVLDHGLQRRHAAWCESCASTGVLMRRCRRGRTKSRAGGRQPEKR